MKKIYISILFLTFTIVATSQTVAWSSDLEDTSTFTFTDEDGDANEWLEASSVSGTIIFDAGFSEGAVLYSESWRNVALTPDNRITTPSGVISIPATAEAITFKMKVGAPDPDFPTEKFAVYVFDEAIGSSLDTLIYEETLVEGGVVKDITAAIPVTFAGKSIGIIVRHYDSTDVYIIAIDDLEVSYSQNLGTEDIDSIENTSLFYPNPVKDILNLSTEKAVQSVAVFNQLGQEIMGVKETKIINNTVDLSGLAKGIYLVNVTSDSISESFTIIKE